MELTNLEKILSGSEYEDSAPCLKRVFDKHGIKALGDLERSIGFLNGRVCQVSLHQLVAYIQEHPVSIAGDTTETEEIKEEEVEENGGEDIDEEVEDADEEVEDVDEEVEDVDEEADEADEE